MPEYLAELHRKAGRAYQVIGLGEKWDLTQADRAKLADEMGKIHAIFDTELMIHQDHFAPYLKLDVKD